MIPLRGFLVLGFGRGLCGRRLAGLVIRGGTCLDDGWLFPGQHAIKSINTRQLYRIVVEAAQAVDIAKRVGPHTMRHSFATHRKLYPAAP